MIAEITIGGVEKREGTSRKTGKPYTKYVVHDEKTGAEYSTFDATIGQRAFEHTGRRGRLDFKVTQFGNDIESLEVLEPSPPGADPEPVSAQLSDGSPDWDLIGLHKTRCALWCAFFATLQPSTATAYPEEIFRVGRRLVELAESDIFHRDPAGPDEAIPF